MLDDAPSLLDKFSRQINSILGVHLVDRSCYQVVLTAASCDPVSWPRMLALTHGPVCVLTSAVDVLLMKGVALVGGADHFVQATVQCVFECQLTSSL